MLVASVIWLLNPLHRLYIDVFTLSCQLVFPNTSYCPLCLCVIRWTQFPIHSVTVTIFFRTSSSFGVFFWSLCFVSSTFLEKCCMILCFSLAAMTMHSMKISGPLCSNQQWNPGAIISHAGFKLVSLALKSSLLIASASPSWRRTWFCQPHVSAMILCWSLSFEQ